MMMTATAWKFRPMRPADLDEVVAAEQRVYTFPWSRGNFADSLAAGHSAWVAFDQGMLAGYAVMMMAPEEAELLNISVVSERQRQGLGGELLSGLCERARQCGARRMLLEVRLSNTAGLGFYAHAGFRQIGRRKAYYPAADGREDALVMEMLL
jgi:[ribosomal protein S18]-alanine N-acetyltransferase